MSGTETVQNKLGSLIKNHSDNLLSASEVNNLILIVSRKLPIYYVV